jgi:hypothetical protein
VTASHHGRPRPRARLVVDPDNAYARLGVSPLASTDEIKALCNRKRTEAAGRGRGRVAGVFGDADAEMATIQQIEAEIGSPRARTAYDRDHPQNELLTVQPGPRDRALEPARATAVLTAWVEEALGSEGMLPSPSDLALWAPGGVSAELAAALEPYEAEQPRQAPAEEPGAPAPEELDRAAAPAKPRAQDDRK